MSLHFIMGPMFSGKSTLFIKYIRQFKTLDYSVLVIKPDIDNRYSQHEICTHHLEKEPCTIIPVDGLLSLCETKEFQTPKLIMIDEGQFFKDLYQVVKEKCFPFKKHVYITALNGDSERQLFGEIYQLLPLCTKMELLQALCIRCKNGTPAVYSKRISESTSQIQVGTNKEYEAVCFEHYESL